MEHSVSSIFIGGVRRKNNRDEIVGIFIQEKVWLRNRLSPSEGGGREVACPGRETGHGGQRPQVEACSTYMREKWPCARGKKGGPWDGTDQTIMLQVAVSFV